MRSLKGRTFDGAEIFGSWGTCTDRIGLSLEIGKKRLGEYEFFALLLEMGSEIASKELSWFESGWMEDTTMIFP